MKKTYYIGSSKPWRFSKERAAKLMKAVIIYNATLTAALDSTCPAVHALFIVEIDKRLKGDFEKTSGIQLEIPPRASGSVAM